MISDLDIYRATNLLVKQHGEDAPTHAAMRADRLLEQGDRSACDRGNAKMVGWALG